MIERERERERRGTEDNKKESKIHGWWDKNA
jgi:hypothetical protein